MSMATELMVGYAHHHRDRRNLATHLIGIPMIVFAVGALLARPSIAVGGWPITPSALLWAAATLWTLTRGDLVLGVATSLGTLLLFLGALPLAQLDTAPWLAWSGSIFALGWVIQIVGHYYEGHKPAFFDDLRSLLVGPMFVTAEALFALGWGQALQAEIERRAGPTQLRDLHAPAAR